MYVPTYVMVGMEHETKEYRFWHPTPRNQVNIITLKGRGRVGARALSFYPELHIYLLANTRSVSSNINF